MRFQRDSFFWQTTDDIRETPMHRPYQLAEGGRSAYRSKQGAPNQISTFDQSRYKNNFYHFIPILAQLFKGPYQVFVNTSEPHKIPISAANLEFIDK